MFYRISSDIHSGFWPESKAKARKLTDLRVPDMDADGGTILLLPGDTGSHKRRSVYAQVIERLAERFLAV